MTLPGAAAEPPTIERRTRRRRAVLAIVAAAITGILAGVRAAVPAGDVLTAELFGNTTWTPPGLWSSADVNLSPERLVNRAGRRSLAQYSIRWTGYLTVSRNGLYTFSLTSDDGSTLNVDDRLVVENGGPHSAATKSGSVHLERGSHRIVLDYVQYGASAVLDWSWSVDGEPPAPVAGWMLSQRRTRYSTARNARVIDWTLLAAALASAVAALSVLSATAGVRRLSSASVRVLNTRTTRTVTSAGTAVTAAAIGALLFVPWPGGAPEWPLYRSSATTVRDVWTTLRRTALHPRVFQAALEAPRSGEEQALALRIRELNALVQAHHLERFRLSSSLAADDWTYQQIVSSSWPSKVEPDAPAQFILNNEPLAGGCRVVQSATEVSLVHCS